MQRNHRTATDQDRAAQMQPDHQIAELSDDELDAVAGGRRRPKRPRDPNRMNFIPLNRPTKGHKR